MNNNERRKKIFWGKFFCVNQQSATIALRKFEFQKSVRVVKKHLASELLIKLARQFEETRKLEDRIKSGQPRLMKTLSPLVAVKMEVLPSIGFSCRVEQCSTSAFHEKQPGS